MASLDWAALVPRIGLAQAAVARFDGNGRVGRMLIPLKTEINEATRSQYALQTLDALFTAPFLTAPDVTKPPSTQPIRPRIAACCRVASRGYGAYKGGDIAKTLETGT